jgi:hypothetical protein
VLYFPDIFTKPQTFNYNSTRHINRSNLMHKLRNTAAQNRATFLHPVKLKKNTRAIILAFTAKRQWASVFAYKTLTKYHDAILQLLGSKIKPTAHTWLMTKMALQYAEEYRKHLFGHSYGNQQLKSSNCTVNRSLERNSQSNFPPYCFDI